MTLQLDRTLDTSAPAPSSNPAVVDPVSRTRRIAGRLRPGATALDAIRAAFPPGSMTGAPKLRTCEIIDALERGPRGVYSGIVGYLGYSGEADFSVVIRTAVRAANEVTVGAGGAIVLDSDPAAELAERNLKAQSVLGAWS